LTDFVANPATGSCGVGLTPVAALLRLIPVIPECKA